MKDDKYYIYAVVLLVVLSVLFMEDITGHATDDIVISIREKTDGKIIYFSFNDSISVGDRQNIAIEFVNTGSTSYTSKIEVKIHKSLGDKLNLTAYYQDSSLFMYPGSRRRYSTVFIPSDGGLYYIQVRVTFGTRVAETWGAFFVTDPFNVVTGQPGNQSGNTTGNFTGGAGGNNTSTSPGSGAGGGAGSSDGTGGGTSSGTGSGASGASGTGAGVQQNIIFKEFRPGFAAMESASADAVHLHRGDPIILDIKATNTGEVDLTNIKIFISTSSSIGVEINPKALSLLEKNESVIFLLTLSADDITELGEHLLSYSIVSDEARKDGSVGIAVVDGKPGTEEIKFRIVNYQVLILELQDDISDARRKGFSVEPAAESLKKAKGIIEKARRAFEAEEYEEVTRNLLEAQENLQDSAFLLSSATLFIYSTAPVETYLALIILSVAILSIFIYRIRMKKKSKRPKMLQQAAEEP